MNTYTYHYNLPLIRTRVSLGDNYRKGFVSHFTFRTEFVVVWVQYLKKTVAYLSTQF